MFCSECGQPASGKFCSHCGHPLQPGLKPAHNADAIADLVPVELVIDWENEICYETLLKVTAVRDLIAAHQKRAKKQMTGEQFLSLAEKLVPLPVPYEPLAKFSQKLWSGLGIKTGQERTSLIEAPVGKVIVRALCSLALHNQTLRGVTQAQDGCSIEASLPSDFLSLEGDLFVNIHRDGRRAGVTAATRIEGQYFDWGKSRRALDHLFGELSSDSAIPRAA